MDIYRNKAVPKVQLQQNYVRVLCSALSLSSSVAVLTDRKKQIIPPLLLPHNAANLCHTDGFMLKYLFTAPLDKMAYNHEELPAFCVGSFPNNMRNSSGEIIELGTWHSLQLRRLSLRSYRIITELAKLAVKWHLNSKGSLSPYVSERHAIHLEILTRSWIQRSLPVTFTAVV